VSRSEARARHAERRLHEGLARGDIVGVATRLLQLSPSERGPFMGAVARMVRGEIAQAQHKGTWHQLTYWAARYEREPGLVEAGASDGEGLAAHWALFWGCARAGEWRRAGLHLVEVREPLAARAPALALALSQYVKNLGQLEPLLGPDLWAWMPKTSLPGLAEGQGACARSGPGVGSSEEGGARNPPRDARSLRRMGPPPTNLEDVERALLDCYRTTVFSRFQATVLDWLGRVPASHQRALRLLAVPLAVHVQLERSTSPSANGHRSWVPAAFAGRLICEEDAPPELAEEALLLFRMLSAELARAIPKGQKGESRREEIQALASVAEAAMLYPQHRRLVEAALAHGAPVEALLGAGASRILLPIFERLLRIEASVPLWRRALQLWYLAHEKEKTKRLPPPRWLDEALERLLKTPEKWVSWLRGRTPDERSEDLAAFSELLSVPLCADLVDVLWGAVGTTGGTDEELCGELAKMVLRLLERQQSARRGPAGSFKMGRRFIVAIAAEMGFDLSEVPDDLIQFALDGTPEGREIQRQLGSAAPLDPSQLDDTERALWARFGERVLPYEIDFLEIALCLERSPAKRKQLVARFLGTRDDIVVQLELLRDAHNAERPRAQNALQRQVLEQHAADPVALARGLKMTREEGAPFKLQRPLATMLLAAAANSQASEQVPKAELAYARRLVAPSRKRPTKTPRGKAHGRRPVQLELPAGEKTSRRRQKGQR
jgi:hypothetical protein